MLKNKDLIKRVDFSKEIIDSKFNKFEADLIGGKYIYFSRIRKQSFHSGTIERRSTASFAKIFYRR